MLEGFQIEQIAAPVTWRLRLQVLQPQRSLKEVMLDDDFAGYHFGAYAQEGLVGVISLVQEGDAVRCCHLAVLAEYRKQGVGTALLRQALSFAVSLGAQQVWAEVPENACHFYKRLGFQLVGEIFFRQHEAYRRIALTV